MKRELIVNASPHETRVALLEDGIPVECLIQRARAPSILGNIYRGRVSSVLPGMQSAFVDVGMERHAYLYVTDLFPSRSGEPVPTMAHRGPSVESLLSEGKEILVQVTREAMGGKGPRVTTQISLPGRSLVFLPGSPGRSVSRRVEDAGERERLQQMVADLPGEGGFIVRTAAAGLAAATLESEAVGLRRLWAEIRKREAELSAPSCVHAETDLAVKALRDLLVADMERIVVDAEEVYGRCREYVERVLPALAGRVERHDRPEGIFATFGVEKELDKALRRRVWLPSGGYLLIHPTEALVAIDVNTGRFVGKARFEETALQTNLEAAKEIVRQVRLRDLGGILVIDFIDLEEEESRRRLAGALERELRSDRARSRVLQISDFGLVEITRQRVRRSLESLLCRSCPTCRGTGRVRSVETIRLALLRELGELLPLVSEGGARIRAHPEVAAAVRDGLPGLRAELKVPERIGLEVEAVEEFHPEEYEILTF